MTTKIILFIFITYASFGILASSDPIKYAQTDSRSIYTIKLLKLALSKLEHPSKSFLLKPSNDNVTQGRLEILLLSNQIDIAILPTNKYRESNLLAIKIPLYQGLVGYRVLFINKDNIKKFSTINSIDELKLSTIAGFGAHWADLNILKSNQIKVVLSTNYQGLFSMLKYQRFDYIPRSVPEVLAEYKHFSIDNPNLVIEQSIALYYPLQIYFFVNKGNQYLAKKLEQGLKIALIDGSFKSLFMKHHKKSIHLLHLEKRKLFVLKNPEQLAPIVKVNDDWWLKESNRSN